MGCRGSKNKVFDILASKKKDPSDELTGEFMFTAPSGSDYPPEMVLGGVTPQRQQVLWAAACANPKCRGLDPFSQLLYKAMHKLESTKDFDEATSGGYVLDSIDLKKKELDTAPFGLFRIVNYDEEADMVLSAKIKEWFEMQITDLIRNKYMPPHYDPNSEHNDQGPTFFDSNEEAAVYYHACFRTHLPPLGDTIGVFEPKKMVDGDPATTAFIPHDTNVDASWAAAAAPRCAMGRFSTALRVKHPCYVAGVAGGRLRAR